MVTKIQPINIVNHSPNMMYLLILTYEHVCLPVFCLYNLFSAILELIVITFVTKLLFAP